MDATGPRYSELLQSIRVAFGNETHMRAVTLRAQPTGNPVQLSQVAREGESTWHLAGRVESVHEPAAAQKYFGKRGARILPHLSYEKAAVAGGMVVERAAHAVSTCRPPQQC